MTTVTRAKDCDIYIGRPRKGQPWRFGNPFCLGSEQERERVIGQFRAWLETGETFGCLDATPERREWILANLDTLRGKRLGCWCAPKRCHGEVLAEMADRGLSPIPVPPDLRRLSDAP